MGVPATRWLDLLLPPRCALCGAAGAAGLCAACLARVFPWPADACLRCGRAIARWMAPGPCAGCLRRPPPWARAVHLYAYRGVAREAVLALKLGARPEAARALVALAAGRIREAVAPGDALVPVPSPWWRFARYGVHHTGMLARAVAAHTGARVHLFALRRRGRAPRQSALARGARRRNLAGAFAPGLRAVRGARMVWLVDDVTTTGTTLRRAARALAPLGLPVGVLTLARAGDPA